MSEEAYKRVLDIAQAAAPALPPPVGDVVRFVAAALEWAIELIRNGMDPIKEIERIKSAKPGVDEAEEAWREELARKKDEIG